MDETVGDEKRVSFSKNGNSIKIDDLSTGEKQIVFRGAQLLKKSKSINNGVVLIDEPELNYCRDCNKFFINYISYEEYRKKYGVLIGNVILEDESKALTGDFSLAEASPLKLCGYSVNQQEGLSRETRHYIIQKIISLGVMTKSEVIHYLEYFITMNGKRRGNEIAVSKWKDDLAFTLYVNFENQSKFYITQILKY